MASSPLRIAVVGLGRHASKTVIPAIEAATDWRLAGVVSARPTAGAEAAAEHGIEAWPDLETAIADGDLHCVYLATVPSLHVDAVSVAIDGGVPVVICEKPLGVDGAQVDHAVASAREAGTALYEVMAYQHHPQFTTLRTLVDSPDIGGLVHGYARFSYPFMPEDDYRYRAGDGGGSTLDAGIYPLSLVARMVDVDDVAIQGVLHHGGWEVDVAGAATITDRHGRSFQCSWGMGSAYANLARIVGSAGSVEVPRPFSKPADFVEPMTLIGGWGERSDVAYPGADQFVAMLADVAAGHADPTWRSDTLTQIERRWALLRRVQEESIRIR